MDRESVVEKVAQITTWWLQQRTAKIAKDNHGSMEVNPFLAPLICALHGLKGSEELAAFVTAGHFYIGHGTGFGKLIDEKILPQAFGTEKLDKRYRADHGMTDPAFDDIDHVFERPDGRYLLSQKASKWTIQLGQAMGLNRSFKTLIDMRAKGEIEFNKIVVGVFYGHADDLTDKYRVLRGITTGAAHDVVDVAEHVEVFAGREFWGWLAGHPAAQEWVMSGIFSAISSNGTAQDDGSVPTEKVVKALTGALAQIDQLDSEQSWINFINLINR